jgi:RNA-directed DNA polymerase
MDRYWLRMGSRSLFACNVLNRKGEQTTLALYKLADTPVAHNMRMQSAYNPFDPKDDIYGERRHVLRMSKDIWDAQRQKLWMQQEGRCVACDELLDSGKACDDHHIVYRMYGGSDALPNRVLLHPACHRRVHALGLEVTKPVPVRGL